MSDEGEKIAGFMTLKNDIIDETIEDEDCTTSARILFIITISIGAAVYVLTWFTRWISLNQTLILFGYLAPIPTIADIVLDGVGQILFPVFGWILVFYIGNMLGGEAESKEHLMRAFGYSSVMLMIYHSAGFLNLLNGLGLLVGLLQIVFGLWSIIIYVYATTITFRRGALTAIGAFIIGGILAGFCIIGPISLIQLVV